jgi:hypothetical protein
LLILVAKHALRVASEATITASIALLIMAAVVHPPFEDHAYAVLRAKPLHPFAPRLVEAVNAGRLDLLEALPSAEERAWVRDALTSLGFGGDTVLEASDALLDDLRRQHNDARKRVHADAASERRSLLQALLEDLRGAALKLAGTPGQLGEARASLRAMLASFADQPAAGPVLLGVASLLRAQAEAPAAAAWRVEVAALLNGGDEFVRRAVPLLQTLALQPAGMRDPEAGLVAACDGEEVAFELRPAAWASAELGCLARLIERRAARLPWGARATGQIVETAASFETRPLATWGEWWSSVLGQLLCRLA